MKSNFLLFALLALLCLSLPGKLYSQLWETQTLRTGVLGAWTRSADFDHDNDPDILIQSGDTIFWYENLRPGWSAHIIDTTFYNATYAYVEVADIDGDGDVDVIKAPGNGSGSDELSWNENQNNGATWVKHSLTVLSGYIGWLQNSSGDVDGDGDPDIVISEYEFNNVPGFKGLYWLENKGPGNAWVKQHLRTGSHLFGSLADMDNDGDLDITTSWDSLYWLENQMPLNSWPAHKVADGIGANFVGASQDISGDGLPDVFAAPSANGAMAVYTNPAWEQFTINPANLLYVGPAADLDGDGDLDMPYGGAGGLPQPLGWSENQNNATTWILHDITTPSLLQRIPTGVSDIDGDGDNDLVSLTFDLSTGFGDAIWLKNPRINTSVSKPDLPAEVFSISPNPVTDIVRMTVSNTTGETYQVEIADPSGKKVKQVALKNEAVISLGDLSPGTYFVYLLKEGQMVKGAKIWKM